VRPYRAGHYPNFVEEPADASGFFDPKTWTHLREVKALYDPETCSRETTTSRPADRAGDRTEATSNVARAAPR
jgi:hypothetical protein